MADEPPQDPDVDDDGSRTGPCLDGPLVGSVCTTRYPKGALLCDRPTQRLWIYDWDGDGFRSRSGDAPLVLVEDPDAVDNRWRAAEQGDFDVWAAPWAGGDPDSVDAYAEADPDGEG